MVCWLSIPSQLRVRYNDSMHHAYLVNGAVEPLVKYLGEDASGYDFWRGEFATFGIDESRDIKERAGRKAAHAGAKKIFIISAHSFTIEAQNALLKLFEDPAPDTHFFILTKSAEYLLPTLRSRLAVLEIGGENSERGNEAENFLKKNISERMAFIAKAAKEENAKQIALEIIEGLTMHIRSKNIAPSSNDRDAHERLLRYRGYLFGRSPSVKMILESAALMI